MPQPVNYGTPFTEDEMAVVLSIAETLRLATVEEKGRSIRTMNKLCDVLERAKIANGAHLGVTAMFAAGVLANHCRDMEPKALADGVDPEKASVFLASAFGSLLQAYLQEFFKKIDIERVAH